MSLGAQQRRASQGDGSKSMSMVRRGSSSKTESTQPRGSITIVSKGVPEQRSVPSKEKHLIASADAFFGTSRSLSHGSGSKTATTWRSGTMGAHYDITEEARIVQNTSEFSIEKSRAQFDMYWRTSLLDNQHSITYDFGRKVHLTEINLNLPGLDPERNAVSYNPKCARILYNAEDANLSEIVSTWLPAKREFIPRDAENMQIAWRCEEPARYWRMELPLHWESKKFFSILDIQMIAEDGGSRGKISGLKEVDVAQSAQLGRMTTEFDPMKNLTAAQRDVRHLAKVCNVSVDEAESLKKKFDIYDEDESGLINKEEFMKVLQGFVGPKVAISKERFETYWRDVDTDGSGEVDFEEFLGWYQTIVKQGGLSPEAFYATFGVQRLGRMAEAIEQAEEEANF